MRRAPLLATVALVRCVVAQDLGATIECAQGATRACVGDAGVAGCSGA